MALHDHQVQVGKKAKKVGSRTGMKKRRHNSSHKRKR